MTHTRRSFLQKTGMLLGAFSAQSLFNELHAATFDALQEKAAGKSAEEIASDEDYWATIQQAYSLDPNMIYLNSGGMSPAPKVVQEALHRYNDLTNKGPYYYMVKVLDQGKEPLRQKLAKLAGADTEEIALLRNCTEGLNNVILGLPLKRGDEVIGCRLDYINAVNSWKQRAAREGIVYHRIDLPAAQENDDAIVKAFEKAITPKTKLLHITHVINWTGQILPVKKITAMAAKHGVATLVDGAHSFGLLDFEIPELGCDYFSASLHKYLCAPIGSGMLWVKKSKISAIWPINGVENPQSDNIRKFESFGTHSSAIEQAIGEAINFHETIGVQHKQARMNFLTRYWTTAAQKRIPGFSLITPADSSRHCAIAAFTVDGVESKWYNHYLFVDYKVIVTTVNWENINCLRVSPNIFTSLQDLDKLVDALVILTEKSRTTPKQ